MAEPISITPSDNQAEQRPDRPRYEPPQAIYLGSSHQGRGQLFCVPFGTGDFPQNPCLDGGLPTFCDMGTSFD